MHEDPGHHRFVVDQLAVANGNPDAQSWRGFGLTSNATPYAAMSGHVFQTVEERTLPDGYRKVAPGELGLNPLDFEDPLTGFRAALYQDPEGDLVLAFAGTDFEDFEGDWPNNGAQGTGGVPPQDTQATRLAALV